MRKYKREIVLVTILFLNACGLKLQDPPLESEPPAPLYGNDYYVNSTGSDTTDGSMSQPWQSLAKVNAAAILPGDRVHFQGGQTFNGQLALGPARGGTLAHPITFDSYGNGRATLSFNSDHVISIHNSAGFIFNQLNVLGGGVSVPGEKDAINIYNDLPGDIKLDHIELQDMDLSNCRGFGINVVGGNGRSGFRNITISRVSSHANGLGGIQSLGQLWNTPGAYAHENISISHSKVYDNLGIAGYSNHSGDGIVLGGVDGATVEYNVAYHNGAQNTHVGGPVGIWAWDSNRVTLQFNEAYENHTASTADGGGFDLDGGVSNSVMQYNYSHENDGAGFLICMFQTQVPFTNNTVRFNISQNDGQRNNFGGIVFYDEPGARVTNTNVYHNTVFVSPTSGSPAALNFLSAATTNIKVFNNLFISTGGTPLLQANSAQSGLLLRNNNYWSSGGAFRVDWLGQTYTTLSTWTATGAEQYGGVVYARSINPLITFAGQGGIVGPLNMVSTLSAYRLQNSSPMIQSGIELSQFGITPGSQNFFGQALQTVPNIGAF